MTMKGYPTYPRFPEMKSHPQLQFDTQDNRPVDWGRIIYCLHLSRGVIPLPMSVLDMTQKYQMMRLQFWSFGEFGVPYYSLVHGELQWQYLLGFNLWFE